MIDPGTTVYGPFYRQESETQTAATVRAILASGELHGRAPWRGGSPAVKAYRRPREGKSGMEFYAFVPPDDPNGPTAYWPTARTEASF
ncbi:MAG TPA: hypothetical protein VN238_22650 [Solirubrobacteraceae bacterium]|nr:hypothetical protein [Solirubrobacteraceae bacterium]